MKWGLSFMIRVEENVEFWKLRRNQTVTDSGYEGGT